MKTQKFGYLMVACLMLILLNTSCKKTETIDYPAPLIVTGVQLSANAKFGNILTDNNGRALYVYAKDVAGNSTCIDGCAVTWPPFYKENPVIGTGLLAADFGVITRTDGSKQTTYKGWPLSFYINDNNPGEVNGDAVGNNWLVAKADYTVMVGITQLVGNDGLQYNDQGTAATGTSTYIVDPVGRTLYMFTRDTHNTNTFTKADLSNNTTWPMFEVSAVGSIPSVLDKTQFSTITVFGKTQLIYKGHPLYYFGQDAATRGSAKGVSFPTPGSAIWKVTNNTTVVL